MRLASGGNENHFAAQSACAIYAGTRKRCERPSNAARPCMSFYVMKFEVFQDALPLPLHHLALMMHEIADGEILFEGIVDAVDTALLEAEK